MLPLATLSYSEKSAHDLLLVSCTCPLNAADSPLADSSPRSRPADIIHFFTIRIVSSKPDTETSPLLLTKSPLYNTRTPVPLDNPSPRYLRSTIPKIAPCFPFYCTSPLALSNYLFYTSGYAYLTPYITPNKTP